MFKFLCKMGVHQWRRRDFSGRTGRLEIYCKRCDLTRHFSWPPPPPPLPPRPLSIKGAYCQPDLNININCEYDCFTCGNVCFEPIDNGICGPIRIISETKHLKVTACKVNLPEYLTKPIQKPKCI